MSDSARLVDELTTLLYEPLKGTCLTHTPCVIVACGACHQKADKPEAVVHENDCPVYRLQRAEAANTAVIRANAEEIADLEDVRDALEAKVNALTAAVARAERAEAALRPCALALEYRDGVTCRDERDRGVCLNHRVIEGLRVHAVTADRLEIENRALRRQVRATYGIIHEGLHGGRATDPEGQATCERPSCRNARAALAASSAEGEGA
jgi:hypothetical protein